MNYCCGIAGTTGTLMPALQTYQRNLPVAFSARLSDLTVSILQAGGDGIVLQGGRRNICPIADAPSTCCFASFLLDLPDNLPASLPESSTQLPFHRNGQFRIQRFNRTIYFLRSVCGASLVVAGSFRNSDRFRHFHPDCFSSLAAR